MSSNELVLGMDKKLQITARRLSYSIPEAAQLCGIGTTLLKELIEEGSGPQTFYLHTRRLISDKALVEWLLEQSEPDQQSSNTLRTSATPDAGHVSSH
jgi:hypothetical protein